MTAVQPVLRQARLDNGLRLVVDPDPGLGFVAVTTWHGVGSLHDGPGRSGLAHLAEHVCFGAGPRGAGARATERNATTSFERTCFVDVGPPDVLPGVFDTIAERPYRAVRCTARELDAHRAVVRQEIAQREDAAHFGSGLRRALRLLFGPDHPFGQPALGDPAVLDTLTTEDVARLVHDGYGAAGTVVAVVGSADPDAVLALAGRSLTGLPAAPPLAAPPCPPPTGSGAREDVEEGQPTGLLRLTFALPDDADPAASDDAAQVLAAGLAGAPWTVLGRDFAAEHGVLAATADVVPVHAGPSLASLRLALPAGVDPAVVERAVRDRLDRVAADGLTPDVHAAAVARHRKQRYAAVSGARPRGEELCRQVAAGVDVAPAGVRLRGSAVAGPADVARAARTAGDAVTVTFHAAGPEEPSWIL